MDSVLGPELLPACADTSPITCRTWEEWESQVLQHIEGGELSDVDVSKLLCIVSQGGLLHGPRGWMSWEGDRWVKELSNSYPKALFDTIEMLRWFCNRYKTFEAQVGKGGKTAGRRCLKALQKAVTKYACDWSMNAVLRVSKRALFCDDWDSDPFLLNCPNGIVHLSPTSKEPPQLEPHSGPSDHHITQITNADYQPYTLIYDKENDEQREVGICPRWEKFIGDISSHDQELAAYLQRAVGYSISGTPTEQVAIFLVGDGNNGKSTFLETLRGVLGDYMRAAPAAIITVAAAREGARPDKVALRGVRFLTLSETDESHQLDEAELKNMTGDEDIVARDLYSQPETFKPQFVPWVSTNHLPDIKGRDAGIWRRPHVVELPYQVPESLRVPGLSKIMIEEEGSGILNWALAGYRMWCEGGLQPPTRVLYSTHAYKQDMDRVGDWFNETFELTNETHPIQVNLATENFNAWAKKMNVPPTEPRKMRSYLRAKVPGRVQVVLGKGNAYQVLGLKWRVPLDHQRW